MFKVLERIAERLLGEELAKVIIMVLIVTSLKHAMIPKYTEAINLLYPGIGVVLLIAVSTFFMHKGNAAEEKNP